MADAITAMWARARWKKRQEAEVAQRTCEMGPHCVWRVAGQAIPESDFMHELSRPGQPKLLVCESCAVEFGDTGAAQEQDGENPEMEVQAPEVEGVTAKRKISQNPTIFLLVAVVHGKFSQNHN